MNDWLSFDMPQNDRLTWEGRWMMESPWWTAEGLNIFMEDARSGQLLGSRRDRNALAWQPADWSVECRKRRSIKRDWALSITEAVVPQTVGTERNVRRVAGCKIQTNQLSQNTRREHVQTMQLVATIVAWGMSYLGLIRDERYVTSHVRCLDGVIASNSHRW